MRRSIRPKRAAPNCRESSAFRRPPVERGQMPPRMSSGAYQIRSFSWTIREWRRSANAWPFELWLMEHE